MMHLSGLFFFRQMLIVFAIFALGAVSSSAKEIMRIKNQLNQTSVAAGSWLAANNVHPKITQSILKHSDINLTMSRYTHTLRGQEAQAVAELPDLSLASGQTNIATGTDDRPLNLNDGGS